MMYTWYSCVLLPIPRWLSEAGQNGCTARIGNKTKLVLIFLIFPSLPHFSVLISFMHQASLSSSCPWSPSAPTNLLCPPLHCLIHLSFCPSLPNRRVILSSHSSLYRVGLTCCEKWSKWESLLSSYQKNLFLVSHKFYFSEFLEWVFPWKHSPMWQLYSVVFTAGTSGLNMFVKAGQQNLTVDNMLWIPINPTTSDLWQRFPP